MRPALLLLALVTSCAAADLASDLRRWEGFSATPYADNGGWSWGYGHWQATRPAGSVTRARAEALLAADIATARAAAAKVVPTLAAMPADAQDVVVALAYQLGEGRLRGFKAMRAALARGDYAAAADEVLDSRLARQAPARVAELAARLRAVQQ